MFKIQNGTVSRTPVPRPLRGLKPESLKDLSWTDPALSLQDCAWWPETDQSPALGENQRYGTESYTVDTENQRVIVTREVVDLTAEEVRQRQETKRSTLVQDVASYRYQKEVGGVTAEDGTLISTEREARSLLSDTYQSLNAGLITETDWKTGNGWVTVTAAGIQPIAQLVSTHVKACFSAEREVVTYVANSTDLGSIDVAALFEASYTKYFNS